MRENANGSPTGDLQTRLADDPWSLKPGERGRALEAHIDAQERWLPRLGRLVEPPPLAADFPAFLLETPPFERLRESIGGACNRTELDTETADLAQRFVDTYRGYLSGDGDAEVWEP